MKSTAFVSILAGTLAAAQRPNIAELPYCGQICITNMLALAPSLGCPVVDGRPNHACLCSNANFQYGVRDCTNQSCGPEDANRVLAFAAARCVEPGVKPPAAESSPVNSSSSVPSVTEPSSAHPKTAIATTVSTFSSGGKTYTMTTPSSMSSAAASGTTDGKDMEAEATASTSTTVEIAFNDSTSTSTSITTSTTSHSTTHGAAVTSSSFSGKGAESEGSALMTFALDAVFVGVVGLVLLLI